MTADGGRRTADGGRRTADGGRRTADGGRGFFVVLDRQPDSAVRSELIAAEVQRAVGSGLVRRLEDWPLGGSPILLGGERCGYVLDCPLPADAPWTLAGIADAELAQAAYQLEHGNLVAAGSPGRAPIPMPVGPIGSFGDRGPHARDIYSPGMIRGPFDLVHPRVGAAPSHPILWAHDSKGERSLVVEPDSEGQIKAADPALQPDINEKAARVRATATRVHYNRDAQFNAHSLIVATTERPAIGGRAWPSVILDDREHEYAFALWCNSTLGLLLHWWTSNKTQAGRGTTTVTAIPRIPALDVRVLSPAQHEAAREAFEALRGVRFLPFDQIDEDPARAELDRRLLLDVLGLPPALCEDGGPLALLRRKLAAEPQIHGGKRTRVVFEGGGERAERRPPR